MWQAGATGCPKAKVTIAVTWIDLHVRPVRGHVSQSTTTKSCGCKFKARMPTNAKLEQALKAKSRMPARLNYREGRMRWEKIYAALVAIRRGGWRGPLER